MENFHISSVIFFHEKQKLSFDCIHKNGRPSSKTSPIPVLSPSRTEILHRLDFQKPSKQNFPITQKEIQKGTQKQAIAKIQ